MASGYSPRSTPPWNNHGWRNIGLAKTHLQHVITAAAVNLVRIADWQSGVEPAKTRCSRFAALQMAA
jgi:transposase